ncbi:nucleotidyltransferase domain-containing protein [Actinomadura macra]|uniref:nucleotidyltransferase domain-containing protein n=1 Tax=Actinomadura macra TaxID=46164 RepID=UPI00082961EF|nr:nucleotidyltransferase domain-containing protein [Actinomadura macra]
MGIADYIAGSVLAHPTVRQVELAGSRARGTATELSDWDFHVFVEDFGHIASDLPELARPRNPLAAQWDPLGDVASYLLIFPGPTKIDLLFPDVPRRSNPPWRAGPDTLAAMDAHFWDWTLWLVSKRRRGMTDRVRGELLRMSRHILEPLGIPSVPPSLEEAVARYIRARDRLETRYGLRLPRQLEQEVLPLVHYRPSGLAS